MGQSMQEKHPGTAVMHTMIHVTTYLASCTDHWIMQSLIGILDANLMSSAFFLAHRLLSDMRSGVGCMELNCPARYPENHRARPCFCRATGKNVRLCSTFLYPTSLYWFAKQSNHDPHSLVSLLLFPSSLIGISTPPSIT